MRRALLVLPFLAAPALAQEPPTLVFSNEPSAAHTAAKALLEQEGEQNYGDEFIYVAEIDVDFDGRSELFAFAYGSYFCGTAGCVPRLYTPDGTGWHEIDIGLDEFINSYTENWSLAPEPQNGHAVFVLTESNFTTTFVWDGTAYVSLEALAAEEADPE